MPFSRPGDPLLTPGLPAPRTGFEIPIIGDDVPAAISLRRSEAALGTDMTLRLAKGLLALKVLRESDWDARSLESSVSNGIRRWLEVELGARNLTGPLSQLRFEYGHDCEGTFHQADGEDWRMEFGGPDAGQLTIAFMGLSCGLDRPVDVIVRQRVSELNEAFDGIDLGYAALFLVQNAMRWSTGGVGFADAFIAAQQATEMLPPDVAHDPESTEFGLTTLLKSVPSKVCRASIKANTLERAERECRCDSRKRRRYASVVDALRNIESELSQTCKTFAGMDHTPLLGLSRAKPIVLRWSEDDAMGRIVDDWQEAVQVTAAKNRSDSRQVAPFCWSVGYMPMQVEGRRQRAVLEAAEALAAGDRDLIGQIDPAFLVAAKIGECHAAGTLEAAVKCVAQTMRTAVLLDSILRWLGGS